jgi:hypothetical protein
VSVAGIKGFPAQTRNDILVASNNTASGDVTMSATTSVAVEVNGEGVTIDPTETGGKDVISAREIDALPKGTGFTGLLKTGVAVRPEPLGGQFTINGATGPENSFLIDGQETQNYKNGLLNTNNDIPYQAVQEIQVKSSGFEAEFSGATGGVISAVTKSGSNTLHGEFGYNFESAKLDAGPHATYAVTNSTSVASSAGIASTGQYLEYFHQDKDQGLISIPTASLGGAIIKDRLWFFGIHNPRIVQTTRTTHFVQGFGNLIAPLVLTPAVIAAGGTASQTVTNKTTYNYSNFRLEAAPIRSPTHVELHLEPDR